MPSCSIKQCGARKSQNRPNVTLHRCPNSGVLRDKWLDAIGIENINLRHTQTYICSLHFEESQINRTLDVTRLRENAVPTLFNEQSTSKHVPVALKTGIVQKEEVSVMSEPEESLTPVHEMQSTSTHVPVALRTGIVQEKEVSVKSEPEESLTRVHEMPSTSKDLYKIELIDCYHQEKTVTVMNVTKENPVPVPSKEACLQFRELAKLKKICAEQRKKIKRLNEKIRRQGKKISSLEGVLADMKLQDVSIIVIECLQGNQIIAFPTSTAGNNMIPEAFYTPYGSDFQNVQENRYSLPHKSYPPNMMHGQAQIMSGIDPNYLAAYSNPNAQYSAGHQHMHREMQMERQMQFRSDPAFGSVYQNRSLAQAERNNCKTFAHNVSETPRHFENKIQRNKTNYGNIKPKLPALKTPPLVTVQPHVAPRRPNETETPKNELRSQVLTRFDKLKDRSWRYRAPHYRRETTHPEDELPKSSKPVARSDNSYALHKSGPRAFSGPVEKVLKWHKALQDIGVLIIFEIIAKCVSIQPGKSCSKNLVVRDDNGPAMQVVYYEIDFLLPDIKPPCTVRVVGRMMAGTCRLQAFNVRPATGDDMATLSRRAAVASHHVAKLCKEYSPVEKK